MSPRNVLEKNKSLILYLFFGVCTTLVNILTYWIMAHSLEVKTMPSTIAAWIIAVLFAYFTNRKWVFHSKVKKKEEIIRECTEFFGCRLATGIIDWLCMLVFVDILLWNDIVVKSAANVLVIVINYVASKLIIFRKDR